MTITDQQLPPGVRPARRPRKLDQATPERRLGAEGGALARLTALYATAASAVDELGDPVKPHADLYVAAGADPCSGTLREVDRDGTVVVLRCDECGHETTFKPEAVDRDLRVAGILRRACLPARFVNAKLPPSDGIKQASEHIEQLLETWGTTDAPRPPFLVGPWGRGKTHLLTRAARALIERHEVRVRYCTMADLLDEAKAAMDARDRDPNADTVTAVFDRAASVELLVLDDLVELRSDWQREKLQQLVDRRYRGVAAAQRPGEVDLLPIMGATNVPLAQWPRAFGPSVASRLLDLTHPVAVHGPDWRRR